MGYESYEEPLIRAIIYYYDKGKCTSSEFIKNIFLVFKKYGYDDITNIELGKEKSVDGMLEDYVVRYNKKELSAIDLETEVYKWNLDDKVTYISFIHKEKGHRQWNITWHKYYKASDNTPKNDYTFNFLFMDSSYENFDSKEAENKYVGLFCELADLFEAFYGTIEDVFTAVDVFKHTKEKAFNPKYLQAVYWGNYLGEGYYSKLKPKKIAKSPFAVKIPTKSGMFLAVTDNLSDSKDNYKFRQRKKLLRGIK